MLKRVIVSVFLFMLFAVGIEAADKDELGYRLVSDEVLVFYDDGIVLIHPVLEQYMGSIEGVYYEENDMMYIETPEARTELKPLSDDMIELTFGNGEKMILLANPPEEEDYHKKILDDDMLFGVAALLEDAGSNTYGDSGTVDKTIDNLEEETNRMQYTRCVESLTAIKMAQEMYITDWGEYTDDWDRLATNMIAGCLQADGSDCRGKVLSRIKNNCDSPSLKLRSKYDYEVSGKAKDDLGCLITVTPAGYSPVRYSREACGGASESKKDVASSNGEIDAVAQAMCGIIMTGDVESAFDLMHPNMLEANAEMAGMSVEELKKLVKESMVDNTGEMCRVVATREVECSESITANTERINIMVDRCAEVTILSKTSQVKKQMEETTPLVEVGGKWYIYIP